MAHCSRRAFLAASPIILGGFVAGPARVANALSIRSRKPVGTAFPDTLDPETLRALARTAIEAAQRAGATYADVRISDARQLQMYKMSWFDSLLIFEVGYGIRVLVDGAWSFVSGVRPTAELIVAAAQRAVTTARALSVVSKPTPALVPAPVAQGEWATPVAIDPFSVSPDDHASMLAAYQQAMQRVPGGGPIFPLGFIWSTETRVFASSEGSLTTQRISRAIPTIGASATASFTDPINAYVDLLSPASAGFEITLGPALQEGMKAMVEEQHELLRFPVGTAEIGRYEGVLDGYSVGTLLGNTIAPALELDRALGLTADGAGTSFLAPVDTVLGQQLFSPKLTVTSDRSLPHLGAAQWDDEGVKTEPFPVITRGVVVDYFGTRATANSLAPWYASRRMPLRCHGSAVSLSVSRAPIGCATSLTIEAGASGATLDALIRQINNGVLVRSNGWVNSDQQLAGGEFAPEMLFEVKRGKITRRLRRGNVQFATKKLWGALATLGDASTTSVGRARIARDHMDWMNWPLPVQAPAALFDQLDISLTEGA